MFTLIAPPIVALLTRTQLTNEKWRLPTPSKRQCLCCGTGKNNQLFKCKDVTVGNMENECLEDSPSSHGWNGIAPFSSWGDWTLHLSREECEQYKLSRYAWVICGPADGTHSTKRFLSTRWCPYTLMPYCETVWTKLLPRNGLGATGQLLDPLTPPT
jgi:hypothetical protein